MSMLEASIHDALAATRRAAGGLARPHIEAAQAWDAVALAAESDPRIAAEARTARNLEYDLWHALAEPMHAGPYQAGIKDPAGFVMQDRMGAAIVAGLAGYRLDSGPAEDAEAGVWLVWATAELPEGDEMEYSGPGGSMSIEWF
jgi:hypothetical protein